MKKGCIAARPVSAVLVAGNLGSATAASQIALIYWSIQSGVLAITDCP